MSSNYKQSDNSGFDSSEKRTNLIINYLPQSLQDQQFRAIFAKYGDIRSARIVRNKSNNHSYGFGFVDYFRAEDAAVAVCNLNGSVLDYKTIKVSYARPSGDNIKNANLYVSNLPDYYTVENIKSLFGTFGEIIQCRVLEGGVAFVLYNLHEEACAALESLHNRNVPGTDHILHIKFATNDNKRKYQQHAKKSHPEMRHYTGQPIMDHNQMLGPIRSSSHHSRFNPISQVSYVPSSFPPMPMGPIPMSWPNPPPIPPPNFVPVPVPAAQSHPPPDTDKERVLFVYNIGQNMNEMSLNKLFSFYGPVVHVNVVRHAKTRESKGYAFVTMENHIDAYNAILALHGYQLEDKPLQVSFKNHH